MKIIYCNEISRWTNDGKMPSAEEETGVRGVVTSVWAKAILALLVKDSIRKMMMKC
jgi:hypothetical protein